MLGGQTKKCRPECVLRAKLRADYQCHLSTEAKQNPQTSLARKAFRKGLVIVIRSAGFDAADRSPGQGSSFITVPVQGLKSLQQASGSSIIKMWSVAPCHWPLWGHQEQIWGHKGRRSLSSFLARLWAHLQFGCHFHRASLRVLHLQGPLELLASPVRRPELSLQD